MEFTGERFVPEKLKESDEIYQEHLERYRFACHYVKDLVVLDAACGAGFGSRMMSDFAKQVYGIDISKESVEYAKEKYSNKNIVYEQMDVAKITYPENFFDVVVSFETIEHVPEPEKFLNEIQRVLKAKGRLIISTPNVEKAGKGKQVLSAFHIKEFTLEEILALLRNFKEQKVFAQKMSYHRGAYKKLRLLSRYVKGNWRKAASSWVEKRFPLATGPWLCKILLYEFKYKFTVLEYQEKDKLIRPTIFVILCVKE
jgi:ubiquinone biosynthesis O-methyltransferase